MQIKANGMTEHVHQMIMAMLCIPEIDMAHIVSESNMADLLSDATWAICSGYHTILKASPGLAIFGRDILFRCTSYPTDLRLGNSDSI